MPDGFSELHLNQMSHMSGWRRSCRLIETVVVGQKTEKCCFFLLLTFFMKVFFLYFSHSLIQNWVQHDQFRGGVAWPAFLLNTATSQPSCPLFALLCPCNFPHHVLHVVHLYLWLWHTGSGTQADILEKTMVDLNCETPESLLRPWTSKLWVLWNPLPVQTCAHILGTKLTDHELPTWR